MDLNSAKSETKGQKENTERMLQQCEEKIKSKWWCIPVVVYFMEDCSSFPALLNQVQAPPPNPSLLIYDVSDL
ncbi:hypothetical protein C5167_027240 [Papaver somniferum]|nr:hypothetical protein C5167_027240 [Papaver somniferum]